MASLNALVAALLLFGVCVAKAQVTCNDTIICAQAGSSCDPTALGPGRYPICAAGSSCDAADSICRIGENCTTDSCYDQNYPGVSYCFGTCKYSNIYWPGEPCQYNNSLYVDGGCIGGNECLPNGICSFSTNTSCETSANCTSSQFCDSNTCATRGQQNSSCFEQRECDAELVCTSHTLGSQNRTCQPPFIVPQDGLCDTNFDCVAGLICNGTACVPPTQPTAGECAKLQGFCNPDECACGVSFENGTQRTENGSGSCVSSRQVFSQAYINQFVAFQQCTKAHNCADYWIFNNNGDSIYVFNAPHQCIALCPHDLLLDPTPVYKEGTCFTKYVPPTPPPTTTPPASTGNIAYFTFRAVKITHIEFNVTKLSECASDAVLLQLVQAFASKLSVSTSQIKVIAPSDCSKRQSGQTYTAQISAPGGNALALAKVLSDSINGGTLENAPLSLVVGSASAPQVGTSPPSTAPSSSASLTAMLSLTVAALLMA